MKKIAILGNFPPRRCGIATFTCDLAESLAESGAIVEVIAMNDRDQSYAYPAIVARAIRQFEADDYAAAANYVNRGDFDLVCVQHEYGIYGGPDGDLLLKFLNQVNRPVVTTLHTILSEPSHGQLTVLKEIGRLSDRVITMSHRGEHMLADIYGIPASKISFTPHGIPNTVTTPKTTGSNAKMLTFGLIGKSKGIEFVIGAMPAILAAHPEVTYTIVGATHPQVRRTEGEAYRESLIQMAKDLGVSESVEFVDRFVDNEELSTYLAAADIYITPYLTKNQITSGTLAYAYGSGKAVISTPYWHAEELLKDGAGVLVPFHDQDSIAESVNHLLGHSRRLREIQLAAFRAGEQMTWKVVGETYLNIFEQVIKQSAADWVELANHIAANKQKVSEWPPIDVRHLLSLTDDTGILQHATHDIPNRFEGYCVDDNARAAIVATQLSTIPEYSHLGTILTSRYLSFIQFSMVPETGVVRNFMSYDRRWLETQGSDDSHGRTLWALGVLTRNAANRGQRQLSRELFYRALPSSSRFRDLRSIAFTILGLVAITDEERKHDVMIRNLAYRLESEFALMAKAGWDWFEDHLAYDNARLCEAILRAGDLLGDESLIETGLAALEWLCTTQRHETGTFFPIGSDGFYPRTAVRAHFDQQPLEVTATMDACVVAFEITGEPRWRREIDRAFHWFTGENVLNCVMVNPENGGGYDGLTPNGVNLNQGAESTLAWLNARLTMEQRLSASNLSPAHSA